MNDEARDASDEPIEVKLIAAAADGGRVNVTPEKCEAIRNILSRATPAPAEAPASPNGKWIVVCDDPDRQILFFEGKGAEEAARKTHRQMCQNWTCGLYVHAADLRYAAAGTDTGTNKDGDSLREAPVSASTAGAPAAAPVPQTPASARPDALREAKEALDSVWAAIGDALCSGKGIEKTYANSVAAECRRASDRIEVALHRAGELEVQALEEFTDYFVRNYPGPDTIIHDPKWHAPKIFRAACAALREAAPVARVPLFVIDALKNLASKWRNVVCATGSDKHYVYKCPTCTLYHKHAEELEAEVHRLASTGERTALRQAQGESK